MGASSSMGELAGSESTVLRASRLVREQTGTDSDTVDVEEGRGDVGPSAPRGERGEVPAFNRARVDDMRGDSFAKEWRAEAAAPVADCDVADVACRGDVGGEGDLGERVERGIPRNFGTLRGEGGELTGDNDGLVLDCRGEDLLGFGLQVDVGEAGLDEQLWH